jgi:hypothetical protein
MWGFGLAMADKTTANPAKMFSKGFFFFFEKKKGNFTEEPKLLPVLKYSYKLKKLSI